MPFTPRSCVMMPNEERNTHFGRKFHARPSRGWKLFRSLFASGPFEWVTAPIYVVSVSFTVGSNCDCCPCLVSNGDSYDHRSTRFNVNPRRSFQSSWMNAACRLHFGSHVAKFWVYVALVTVPNRKLANGLPVFGVNGASVPPKL